MPFKPQVVCFGHDQRLLETRKWCLEKIFDLRAISSLGELESLLSSGEFALLILCHTLSADEWREAAGILHSRCPRAKLLGFRSGEAVCEAEVVDGLIDGLDGPRVLLETATAMLAVA